MAFSKIILDGTTLIDLTQDTAGVSDVVSPKTFHKADGTSGTGSVTFSTYYTGSSAPSSSLGVDGDIYLQTSS